MRQNVQKAVKHRMHEDCSEYVDEIQAALSPELKLLVAGKSLYTFFIIYLYNLNILDLKSLSNLFI